VAGTIAIAYVVQQLGLGVLSVLSFPQAGHIGQHIKCISAAELFCTVAHTVRFTHIWFKCSSFKGKVYTPYDLPCINEIGITL